MASHPKTADVWPVQWIQSIQFYALKPEKNQMAGIEWFINFVTRNSRQPLRCPVGCSKTNANTFLTTYLKSHAQFANATRIFNLDETATSTVQIPQKVLIEREPKQVSKCTDREKSINSCHLLYCKNHWQHNSSCDDLPKD
jgi:hypothetical protein